MVKTKWRIQFESRTQKVSERWPFESRTVRLSDVYCVVLSEHLKMRPWTTIEEDYIAGPGSQTGLAVLPCPSIKLVFMQYIGTFMGSTKKYLHYV